MAERTMMSGRGRQRAFALGSGGVIVLVIVGFLLLRFAGSALNPPQTRAPTAQSEGTICRPGCTLIDPAASHTANLQLVVGQQARIRFKAGPTSQCPTPRDPSVVRLDACEFLLSTGSADGLYVARRAGTTDLVGSAGGQSVTIGVIVQ